jgi:hypothetical protein
MDELSSHVRLNLPFKLTTRPRLRLFYLVLESHDGRCYGAAARILHSIVADVNRWSAPMQKLNDLSRSLLQRLEDMLLALKPANPRDQWWLSQAMAAATIGDSRWLLAQQVRRGTPKAFVALLSARLDSEAAP